MKNKLKLHADMGEQIIQKLSQIQELPSYGIVAGGAVEATLSQMAGYSSPINDIDVFQSQADLIRIEAEKLAQGKFGKRIINLGLSTKLWIPEAAKNYKSQTVGVYCPLNVIEDGYGRPNEFTTAVLRYKMHRTYNKGMLNIIELKSSDNNGVVTPYTLFAGFDLNCTHVGIDLRTKKLCWDKAFEKFFYHRQIEVCSAHTPNHTAIRLFKKITQLEGSYCDVPTSLQALTAIHQFCEENRKLQWGSPTQFVGTFGEKYKNAFFQSDSEIRKYFNLIDMGDTDASKEGLYTLSSSFKLNKEDREFLASNKYSIAAAPLLAPAFYQRKLKKSQNKVFFTEDLQVDAPRLFSVLNAQGQAVHKVFGQLNYSKALKIEKLFKEHFLLENTFINAPYNEIVKIYDKHLKGLQGLVNIGLAETCYDSFNGQSLQAFEAMLQAFKEQENTKKIEPLKLMKYENLKKVLELKPAEHIELKEILSERELRIEGAQMSHCVGGYFHKISNGHSRIFSVVLNKGNNQFERATLEIATLPCSEFGKAAGLKQFRMVQLRRKANQMPSNNLKKICDKFIDSLEISNNEEKEHKLVRKCGIDLKQVVVETARVFQSNRSSYPLRALIPLASALDRKSQWTHTLIKAGFKLDMVDRLLAKAHGVCFESKVESLSAKILGAKSRLKKSWKKSTISAQVKPKIFELDEDIPF